MSDYDAIRAAEEAGRHSDCERYADELKAKLSAALLQKSELEAELTNTKFSLTVIEERNKVVERLNGEYRKALEAISEIRHRIIKAGVVNWSADIYPLVAALKVLESERPNHEPDGLKLGESRGLPYPMPINACRCACHQCVDHNGNKIVCACCEAGKTPIEKRFYEAGGSIEEA